MSPGCDSKFLGGPSGSPPVLDPISDQVAYVGTIFTLRLTASDPDGNRLSFSFSSAELPDLGSRAQIHDYPDGSALFSWTPLAKDVNKWAIDFSVTDGDHTVTETISLDVKSSVGANNAPIFLRPQGTGTTLDLSLAKCVDVEVVVDDTDDFRVTIGEEEDPLISGATLESTGDKSATWHWCPSDAQVAAQDRWALILSADDGDNPKTLKTYLIVLRTPPKPECSGAAPAVASTPMDEETVAPLTITATVSDDVGLKAAPLFYYSANDPGAAPDLSRMTQLDMVLLEGSMKSGTWGADVPNPVASLPGGSSASIYYVVVAKDNDDASGTCDHLTQAPTSGAYHMTVTSTGMAGGLDVCEACTADVQCGQAADNCLRIGATGESFCAKACSVPTDCPSGYSCSVDPVMSVDDASARQCVPDSGSCGGPVVTPCTDDNLEENDGPEAAATLDLGNQPNLVSCPSASGTGSDDDYYAFSLGEDSQVTLSIAGGAASDLDLELLDDQLNVVAKSDSLSSAESVEKCLTPGNYFVRVYSIDNVANTYSLSYDAQAMACDGGGTCSDDGSEDDDNATQAREVFVYPDPYKSTTNAICAGDDDWYGVYLYADETIYVQLAFTQNADTEDLDLHFYDDATDLTPCTEEDPSTCTSANGQSTDSNEYYTTTVTHEGLYYVVVHGWGGAENLYDICISIRDGECPAL